jgi:hypothetical protein
MIRCDPLRLDVALVLCAAFLPVAGCFGSEDDLPRESVTGTVTLDGQPIALGTISFTPDGGGAGGPPAVGGGGTIKYGRFSIDREGGLIPGTYKVSINAPGAAPERTKGSMPAAGRSVELPKELIPKSYNAQTTLSAKIEKGGNNDLTFSLKSQ